MQVNHPPLNFPHNPILPTLLSEVQSTQTNDANRQPLVDDHHKQGHEKRRRALVVDDVADVTDMLKVLLTHAGYEVMTAGSAMAAIDAARSDHFDIIISDIGMPQMNGYELAQAVRELPGYQSVPMVALTGYSKFDDRQRSLNAGFNAHLTKPIEPRELLDLIEQL